MAQDPGFEGNDPNFRQVGVRRDGRLMLGNAHTHHSHGSSSSIPSKFETILYSGDSEVDGFASRQTRFKYTVEDLPGPGTYADRDNSMVFQSDSLSKQGYGNGFVSKADRWYSVGGANKPTYYPGPGQYNDQDFIEEKNSRTFNHAKTTSNFKPHDSSAIIPTENNVVPGPGSYNPECLARKRRSRPKRLPLGHSRHRIKSAPDDRGSHNPSGYHPSSYEAEGNQSFMTTAPRFKPKEEAGPPPGAYDVANRGGSRWLDQDVPSAAFASGSDRSTFLEAQRLEEPGPGQYDGYHYEEMRKAEIKNVNHSVFKEGNNTKFGVPRVRRKPLDNYPGPGKYDSHHSQFNGDKDNGFFNSSVRSPRGVDSRMGFSDATRRRADRGEATLVRTAASISASLQRDIIAQTQIRPPGPAYYKPDPIGVREKRSFHLNANKRWTS